MAKFSTWFEGKVYEILKEVSATCNAKCYRYPDKKAAGRGFANSQPADFFLLLEGAHYDIEVKTSENKKDFERCYKSLVKDVQMTAARKCMRAKGKYYFIFATKLKSGMEIWDAKDLIEAYYKPRVIPSCKPIATLDIGCKTNVFAEALTNK